MLGRILHAGRARMNDKLNFTQLQVGSERRSVRLHSEDLDPQAVDAALAGGTKALVRNQITLMYPGYELALTALSQQEGRWQTLGRIAIGKVERAAEDGGPAQGQLIYWTGPHANFGFLDPKKDIWLPVESAKASLLPAGIGAQAQWGLKQALGDGPVPSRALVLGQGLLGHLAAHWLQNEGTEVTVVENSPKRLEFSRKTGLRQRIDTHNYDWMKRLQKWNPGGVDLIVDATCAVSAIESLLPLLNAEGVLCLLGPWQDPDSIESLKPQLEKRNARLAGPMPWFGEAPEHASLCQEWMELIQNSKIDAERLLTHRVDPQEAILATKRYQAGIRSWLGTVIEW